MIKKIVLYIIFIIAVCIGGEFQFYPLHEDVRISFGTPVFFFFLLWSKELKPIKAGILVGISVVLFRSFLYVTGSEQMTWADGLLNYANVFSYYFSYGLFFNLFKTRSYYNNPVIIVLIGMLLENISFFASVSSRYLYLGETVPLQSFLTMFVVSIVRSFFVLAFFNFFLLYAANATEAIYRQKNEEMLLHVSNLYVEMVQLKKSMNNAENITKLSYDLYRNLVKEKSIHAKDALYIAGEVHEIKKDHQRIYSGLARMQVKENSEGFMKIEGIIEVVTECNRRYAELLGKSISIKTHILGEHPEYNCFIVLSLLNNLVSNAIEAIHDRGTISIKVERIEEDVLFQVQDNGPGIAPNRLNLVFEPGYTTKYDKTGVASNGIGLSHVKEVVESLNGKIESHSHQEQQNTTFIIELPVTQLKDSR